MRKIDNLGRIVIPKDFRYILDIKNNDELNIELKDDKIIISKPGKSEAEQRIDKAIEYVEDETITYPSAKEWRLHLIEILKGGSNE